MKKLFLILMLSVISLSGCGKNNPDPNVPDIEQLKTIASIVQESYDYENFIPDYPVYLNDDGQWICFEHGEVMDNTIAQRELSGNWFYHYALIVANIQLERYGTEAMNTALEWSLAKLQEDCPFSSEEEAKKYSIFIEDHYFAIRTRIEEFKNGEVKTPENETSIIIHEDPLLANEPLDD